MDIGKPVVTCAVLGICIMVIVAGCSGDGSHAVATSTQALSPRTFQLTVDRPEETSLQSLAVLGGDEVLFRQHTSVAATSGAAPVVANTGTTRTELLQFDRSGPIVSVASVRLEQGVVVDGFVKTSGSVVNKHASVTGAIIQGASIPIAHEVLEPVAVPGPGLPPATVEDGETRVLSPDAYESLVVRKGGTVKLSAGRYYFGTLDLQDRSYLKIDDTGGAVVVYVVDSLFLHAITAGTGASPAVLFAYFGDADVTVGGVFQGTLVAPHARVDVGRAVKCMKHGGNPHDAVHTGAFFGKQIVIEPHVHIVHASFPWDVFRVGNSVTPTLTCVLKDGEQSFAVFGYENTSATPVNIPVGFSNRLSPDPGLPGQPTVFQSGKHAGLFVVPMDSGSVTWRLGSGLAQANPTSQACGPLGPNQEVDNDRPEKILPQGSFQPPPSGISFQEMSSNGVPFAHMTQVARVEPAGPQPLIGAGRGARAVEVVLVNSTNSTLDFSDGIGEGKITLEPPSAVAARAYGSWETENGKALQGTGGHATFIGPTFSVQVHWDDPFIGANRYWVAISGPQANQFTVDIEGGSGNKSTVFFIVRAQSSPKTTCPSGSFQWIMDNLRQIEPPLGFWDQVLGAVSTPAKRITGVKNWAATGCRVPLAVGRVKQVAVSTDGFFTIDVVLDEFGGALLTGTNKGIRIEVDPLRSAPNPAWLAILNHGGPPAVGQRIAVSGDVLIDHSEFLEIHPTTPIQNAAPCNTFPPGSEPLYCNSVLDSLYSLNPGQADLLMGRAQNRACFLTGLSGALATPDMELAATIDQTTGDWVLRATPGKVPGPLGTTLNVFVGGQARCITNNAVSDEYIWTGGAPKVLEPMSSRRDCFITRVGGDWSTGDALWITSTNDPFLLTGGVGQRGGARCIDVESSGFPVAWGPAPEPRVLLDDIEQGCFFKQIRGPFDLASGSSIDMFPLAQGARYVWTLGGQGATVGAAAACATLP